MSTRPFTLRNQSAGVDRRESGANTRARPHPAEVLGGGVRRGREAGALLLFALALFVALALASARYNPNDPAVQGADWVGPVGAGLATVLIRGFGLVAWLWPVELFLLGLPLLGGRSHSGLGLRIAGDLVVAIVLAALLQVAWPDARVFSGASSGGNVGLLFGELMRGLFSSLGSLLVGSTAVALILIGRSSFSFIKTCRNGALLIQTLLDRLLGALDRARTAWVEARRLHRERREKDRARPAPQIDARPSDEAIILHLEDDDSSWLPLEATGPPPLALSEALKRTTPPALEETPAVPRAVEPADPPAARAPAQTPPSRKSAKKAPRIVDTKPQQRVERTDGADLAPPQKGFQLPGPELLESPAASVIEVDKERILENAELLEKTLADYGVSAKVEEIHPGPTVTTYEVAPEAGTKVSKVANLSDDLALGLSRKVRIIAPIPGKSRIGFELPNDERIPVNLRELIEDKRFDKLSGKAPLPVVLGRDIVGAPYYADLASMPHVIVAGATGAGKSVGLNVMLSSLLFRRTPEELRLLMIDPKVVELAPFDGIPHMLLPVVTDMKQAATALKWAVDEMERRYQLFATAGTRNITTYNHWVQRVIEGELPVPSPDQVEALCMDGTLVSVPGAKDGGDGRALPSKLPYIVIVVDEFADLMMQQGKEVEASVARLAQKARAAGMHVVLATQRPSVDVITGMIKANFPSRIGFRVAQKVDSRTILDEQGAELLLGRGDMLVKMNGSSETRRVQCPFISEEEVRALTDHLRAQGEPHYHELILQADADDPESAEEEPLDARFDEAVRIVADTQRCSTSWLQRKMTIGYNRAAKMVEMMEKRGMVGPANGARDREVFVSPQ